MRIVITIHDNQDFLAIKGKIQMLGVGVEHTYPALSVLVAEAADSLVPIIQKMDGVASVEPVGPIHTTT